jgi:hypothetical protein
MKLGAESFELEILQEALWLDSATLGRRFTRARVAQPDLALGLFKQLPRYLQYYLSLDSRGFSLPDAKLHGDVCAYGSVGSLPTTDCWRSLQKGICSRHQEIIKDSARQITRCTTPET